MRPPAAPVLVVALSLAACAGPRLGDSPADLVLEDLLAPGRSRLAAREPPVERIAVAPDDRRASRRADLYRTGGRRTAGIVLVPGLAPAAEREEARRADGRPGVGLLKSNGPHTYRAVPSGARNR